MINIGTHDLQCITDQEYAALALFMQCTAEAIDAQLTEQQANLEMLTNRDAIILTPSVAVVSSDVDTLYDTVTFDNSDFLSLVTGFTSNDLTVANANGIAIGSPTGSTTVIPYLAGLYEYGIYAEGTATAPVLNADARGELNVWGPDGESMLPGATANDKAVRFQCQEDSAGIMRINGKATIVLDGTDGVTVTARIFRSGGTASWATASFFWVRYLGPSTIIEVS